MKKVVFKPLFKMKKVVFKMKKVVLTQLLNLKTPYLTIFESVTFLRKQDS